ncbi:MAG: PhzF family phenazine biosynthesis protein [Microscillaceae bacterium]|nr:PhzF family phenazine biosynthesis protein [Microscillaceae bacterium]MDW8461860.1 PhzF family phenazine biosynthesis protein [Cytophagales bacterium]
MKINIYQINAFAEKVFEGNSAAVCLLESWLESKTLQNIATENNLSETAFVVPKADNCFEIRWFTPTTEVALCGHATLAAAYVLWQFCQVVNNTVYFESKGGELIVRREGEWITLDFPADEIQPISTPLVSYAFDVKIEEAYKGKTDYLLITIDEQAVRKAKPNLEVISNLEARGVILSARSETVDFVSRFFAPQYGINEDAVTGSAHTTLAVYWAKTLRKNNFEAKQLSARKGYLRCQLAGKRVLISGKAQTYLVGEIFIPEV